MTTPDTDALVKALERITQVHVQPNTTKPAMDHEPEGEGT